MSNKKISDLQKLDIPSNDDLFVYAREDQSNFKIEFVDLAQVSAESANSVFVTGDQLILGNKTFANPILGNLDGNISGNAETVTNGVYLIGDQTISGVKTFDSPIVGNLDGSISGNAESVTHGVYVTGNQIISGVKIFDSPIVGNLDGNISGNAETVTHGVYLTGNQFISGIKTFELPIVGNLDGNISGNAETVTHGVYLTGNQFISGIKTFELPIVGNLDGSISGNAETVTHGVYVTGDQVVSGIKNYSGQLLVSGHNVITEHTIYDFSTGVSLVLADIDQLASGKKTFLDQIKPSGHIVTANESGSLVITNDPNPNQYAKNNALTLGFESGVFVTGSKLYVEQGIVTDEIESLDNIIGDSGAMVITDGRDPDLFEGPDESLTLAFRSGVFVTGSKLYVEQGIVTDEIESLDNIIGDSGAMVITDGRDPDLFEGPDESLTLAFKSGVFITGAPLYSEFSIIGNLSGNISGNAETVTHGVYVTGDQVISGIKTFDSSILGNLDGDISGNAETVTSGVYVSGDQIISGLKTFDSSIVGNLSGNISGNAETVTDGVYTTGDQSIFGHKTFKGDVTIEGNLDATSIVNLKLSDYVHIYFNDNDSGKTIYLPLHPGESATKERATALTQSSHIIVAPQDGRIVRALCRPRAQKGIATKSRDFEFNILTGVQNQAVDGDPTDIGIIETTPLQTIPVNPNQTYNFEFSQLQHFSSGDAFLISINRPSASEGDTQCHINVTMEFQYFI